MVCSIINSLSSFLINRIHLDIHFKYLNTYFKYSKYSKIIYPQILKLKYWYILIKMLYFSTIKEPKYLNKQVLFCICILKLLKSIIYKITCHQRLPVMEPQTLHTNMLFFKTACKLLRERLLLVSQDVTGREEGESATYL